MLEQVRLSGLDCSFELVQNCVARELYVAPSVLEQIRGDGRDWCSLVENVVCSLSEKLNENWLTS